MREVQLLRLILKWLRYVQGFEPVYDRVVWIVCHGVLLPLAVRLTHLGVELQQAEDSILLQVC